MLLRELQEGDKFRYAAPVSIHDQEAIFKLVQWDSRNIASCVDKFGKLFQFYAGERIIKIEDKMKIEVGKKYKMHNGHVVTILTTNRYPNKAEPAILAIEDNGTILTAFSNGYYTVNRVNIQLKEIDLELEDCLSSLKEAISHAGGASEHWTETKLSEMSAHDFIKHIAPNKIRFYCEK
jgi:hypothetical protein